MKNERQLFEAAIEISNRVEREDFLTKECGTDLQLLSRLKELLEEHFKTSEFLSIPVMEQISGKTTLIESPNSWDANATLDLPPETKDFTTRDLGAEEDFSEIEFNPHYLLPSTTPGSLGKLGHYDILEVLGHGGFGTVFKAFDEKLHRIVAIKVMSPMLAATSPPRKRFLREARSAAAIKHENVVQVYAVEEQPLPYLVMEYIEGETLQQYMERTGPLEPTLVLRIARQIASGLEAAHAQGLIHRDVKPGNILVELGTNPRIKITDFGLARSVDDASMTRTGIVSGTPMYMAPEQALGQAMDQRTDLFSLGSVLYQMACGRPPFREQTSLLVLKRVIEDDPRPLQEVLSEIPDWLAQIVHTLLQKKPENRIQSSAELASLLARCESEMLIHGKVREGTVTAVLNPRVVASSTVEKNTVRNRLVLFSLIPILLVTLVILGRQYWGTSFSRNPTTSANHTDAASQKQSGIADASANATDLTESHRNIPNQTFVDFSSPWKRIENLGPVINSPQREANAVLTSDQLTMVFTLNNELFQASRQSVGDRFTSKRRLQGAFASNDTTAPWYCISGDGLELVFNSNEGTQHDVIYVCQRKSLQEEFGESQRLEGVSTSHLTRHPILSPNGLWLVVTVGSNEKPQGAITVYHRESRNEPFELAMENAYPPTGTWDIANCISDNGLSMLVTTSTRDSKKVLLVERKSTTEKFERVSDLPAVLAETGMDTPWLTADGRTIYFHSRELADGEGNLDIWVAHRE